VLAAPPPGADATERAPAAQRVEGRDRFGEHAGGTVRHRGHERAEPKSLRPSGEQSERHEWLGNRIPRPTDLRDLDQMVHERDPAEPGRLGRRRDRRQPPGGIPAPRELRDLEDELERDRRLPLRLQRLPRPDDVNRLWSRVVSEPDDEVPAFVADSVDHRPHGTHLLLERRGRDPLAPRRVPRPAYRLVGVGQHGDRGQLGGSRRAQVRESPLGFETQRVDHGRQPTSQSSGEDLVEEGERVFRGVEIVLAASDHRPQRIRRDDLLRPVA
jgi:hypothetical protein